MHINPLPFSRNKTLIIASVSLVLVGFIDYITGNELSLSVFYLFPISLVAANAGKTMGIAIALVSALVEMMTHILYGGSYYSSELIHYWNTAILMAMYVFFAILVTSLKKAYKKNAEHIDELERLTKELTASYHDMESFSYSVSHDLRQPLIVIEGYARNLAKKRGDKLDDYGKENLSVIRDQAAKMTMLINDLLSFCRVSSKEIQKSDIDIRALTQSIVEEVKGTIGERNVQFELRDLPPIRGDASMIRQVIINLLSNALKYTRPRQEARIEIGGAAEEGANVYYVKDNGVGFDGDKATNLFKMFHRLHSSQEFEGTGVGLVIAQRVVTKHGGRIWAEGKINEGATYYFSLPKKL